MKNKEIKNNLLYLLISITVFGIINLLNVTIGSRYVTGAGEITSIQGKIVITVIYLPALLGYLFYIFKIFKKLKYFNFIHFIVGLFNIFILFIYALGGPGGYVCADLVFLFIAPLYFGIPYFLMQDIKSWIEYVRNRK